MRLADAPPRASSVDVASGALVNPAGREAVRSRSVEVHPEFTLAFVEFDDQGRFWDRAQVDLVERTLEAADAASDTEGVAVVFFAHGWRHGCDVCDSNVTCFRTFLRQIHRDVTVASELSGGALKPKRVIGVYAGWRGLSARVQPLESLTFWSRKHVAERIGQGDLVELLTRLELSVAKANARDPRRARFVVIGHSFGGTMVFTSLANVLKTRVLRAGDARAAGEARIVRSFGDLVVLLNPAFEASLYAPLDELAASFPGYSPRQPPVLVTVTSETDSPNGTWFPLGRRLDTLFQKSGTRSPRRQIVTAVGNYEPFWTHRLTAADLPAGPRPAPRAAAKTACRCDLPVETIDPAEAAYLTSLVAGRAAAGESPAGMEARYGRALLTTVKRVDPRNPFWVVRASDEVIHGHNGIFTTYLIDFIRRVIIEASVRARA